MDKRDARKLSTEAQQELRTLAVQLKESGKKYSEIAEIIKVHPTTICTWYKAYQKGGFEALKIKKRGRRIGACKTLSPLQEDEIRKHLIDKYPDQLKLPFALWTRVAVQQLINELFSIKMPIRTVGEYLMRWNFTPQRPLRKAYKQNPKAVDDWLKTSIHQLPKGPRKKKLKYTGATKQVFVMTAITGVATHHVGKHHQLNCIRDVNE